MLRIRSLSGVVAVLALVVTTTAGCGHQADAGPGSGTNGPLRVDDEPGGLSVYPPKHLPPGQGYWASFGGRLICADDDVTLGSIRATGPQGLEPVGTEFLIRSARADQAEHIEPFASALGRAPKFAEAYNTLEPLQGRVVDAVPGTKVTKSCRSSSPRSGWSELVIAVQAPPGGARITKITINYQAGRKQHRLILHHWVYTVCGTKTGHLHDCKMAPE